VHELLHSAEQETDAGKRLALYARAQERASELAPLVPLAHAHQLLARSTSVTGIVNHPTGVIRFAKARFQ
jgi:ABC-type transport system substrate-binding protein